MSFVFNKGFFLLTFLLFLVEILIAVFVRDNFIRPFIGDTLIVILIYGFLRIFLKTHYLPTAFGVLVFAYLIEMLQYFEFVKLIGMEDNRIVSVALGRTFEWLDFAAYFAGFLLIIVSERIYERYKTG